MPHPKYGERRIFSTVEETGITIVMCREPNPTDIQDVANWLNEEKPVAKGYQCLRSSEAIPLIKGRKLPTACFPVFALSEDSERAQKLCSQGVQHAELDPKTIPALSGIFILFKEKEEE